MLSLISDWAGKDTFDAGEKVAAIKKIYNEVGVLDHAKGEMDLYFAKAWKDLDRISVDDNRKDVLRSFSSRLIKRDQ